MTTPEAVHPLVKKVFDAKPPIAQLIGFAVEEISRGLAVAVLEAGPQHANPMGTLHGGVLCDLADAAMGNGFRFNTGARRIFHDDQPRDELSPPGLDGTPTRRSARGQSWKECRVSGM